MGDDDKDQNEEESLKKVKSKTYALPLKKYYVCVDEYKCDFCVYEWMIYYKDRNNLYLVMLALFLFLECVYIMLI